MADSSCLPTECMRVWEAVARINASAAWNLVMNQGIASYAARLPEAGVKELFSNGIPTIAGALIRQLMRDAWRADGGSLDRCLSGVGATGHSGSRCLRWKKGADRTIRRILPKGIRQRVLIHGTPWGCGAPGPPITGRRRSFRPEPHDSAGGTVDQPRSWVHRPIVPYVALAEYPRGRHGVRRCRRLRARGCHRTVQDQDAGLSGCSA